MNLTSPQMQVHLAKLEIAERKARYHHAHARLFGSSRLGPRRVQWRNHA